MRKCICKREQPKDGKRNSKRRRKGRNRQREWNRKTKIAISFELVGEDLGANRSELESQDSVCLLLLIDTQSKDTMSRYYVT